MVFRDVFAYWELLLHGLTTSLFLCLAAGAIGFGIAVACAGKRNSNSRIIRFSVGSYVEFIRNTPFLVQLFFIYFGLASFGMRLRPDTAAVIALSLNVGAYFSEIIRGGLEDSGRGIMEAAVSQGMTPAQIYLRIMLPPALAKIDKALVSQFVLVFLGSAVISQISVGDLTDAAQFIQTRTFRAFEVYFIVTLMYVVSGLVISLLYAALRPYLFPWLRSARQ